MNGLWGHWERDCLNGGKMKHFTTDKKKKRGKGGKKTPPPQNSYELGWTEGGKKKDCTKSI